MRYNTKELIGLGLELSSLAGIVIVQENHMGLDYLAPFFAMCGVGILMRNEAVGEAYSQGRQDEFEMCIQEERLQRYELSDRAIESDECGLPWIV